MHTLRGTTADGRIEEVVIGVVGGGSRGWARTLMNDLGQTRAMGGTVRLYDVDAESAKRNERLGELIQDHPDAVGEWEYEAVESLETALDGADFVVCSTQDPPTETMVHDLDVPAEYGIYQTVGDTVGPGGTLRAMRAIPQYREIAAAVRERCPDAWVFNFTNPMTVCTRTLYAEYPGINAIGLCHEVFHTQRFIAELLAERLDVERPPRDEIDVNVKGINHFTWIDEIRWRGRDCMPVVSESLAERTLPPYEPGDMHDEGYMTDHHAITADLHRTFDLLPAAGDRHLAEFVPWYLDIDDPEAIHRWGVRLTPSEYRIDHWPEGERTRERLLDGEDEFEFERTGEEMVDIMLALLGVEALKTNANVPNRGQVSNLPEDAVVETNVLFTADNCTPLAAGGLPPQVREIVGTHVANQETLVDAGFDGDLDRAYRAFRNDPLVTIEPTAARDLFADLVDRERPYLREWRLDDADVLS